MAEKLHDTFGSGGLTITFIMGEACGASGGEHLLRCWGALTANQRLARFKRVISGVSRWGFGCYELLKFSRNRKGELEIVFRLWTPERRISRKSAEALSFFLKGFFKGLASKVFDAEVTCDFLKVDVGKGCYEFALHAKGINK